MRVETFEESLKLGKVWVYQTDDQRGFVIAPNIRLATYIANELIADDSQTIGVYTKPLTPETYAEFCKVEEE
jgi:hypothetical protein|tara:strand:+ start:1109 stop:1324 length:216 start_codon:yes stop_codon:yes gene_type:complete